MSAAAPAAPAAPKHTIGITDLVKEVEKVIAAAGTIAAGGTLPFSAQLSEFGQVIGVTGTIQRSAKPLKVSAWQDVVAIGTAALMVELTGHADLRLSANVAKVSYLLVASLQRKH